MESEVKLARRIAFVMAFSLLVFSVVSSAQLGEVAGKLVFQVPVGYNQTIQWHLLNEGNSSIYVQIGQSPALQLTSNAQTTAGQPVPLVVVHPLNLTVQPHSITNVNITVFMSKNDTPYLASWQGQLSAQEVTNQSNPGGALVIQGVGKIFTIQPIAPPLKVKLYANRTSITAGQSVAFTYNATGGAGGNIYSYSYKPSSGISQSGGIITFADAGTYNVTLTVTDSVGLIANASVVVNVAPAPVVQQQASSNPIAISPTVAGGAILIIVIIAAAAYIATRKRSAPAKRASKKAAPVDENEMLRREIAKLKKEKASLQRQKGTGTKNPSRKGSKSSKRKRPTRKRARSRRR